MPKIHPINTGFFHLDGGTMFGVIPRDLWQNQIPPDSQNRIPLALRTLLIIDGQRKIIADQGLGNWHNQKFIDRYAVENPNFDFNLALKTYDSSPEDITDVVVTHLHFDHAGGIVTKTNSELLFTFPNATVWLQTPQLQWAKHPCPKDRASFMPEYISMLENYNDLNLIQGDTNITPNVKLLVFNGHTPAMQTVKINTETNTHFFASDLIPTAAHLHIPCIAAYDNNSVLVAEEKEKILSQACAEDWLIYFPHDPTQEKARVTKKENKYTIS